MTNRNPNDPVARQVADFNTHPPLSGSFPLTLSNGAIVPGVTVRCRACGNLIDPPMIRGRVYQSLPAVTTIVLNAVCAPCGRLVHVDGRYRVLGDSFQFELPDSDGRWHCVTKPERSLFRRLRDELLALLRKHAK